MTMTKATTTEELLGAIRPLATRLSAALAKLEAAGEGGVPGALVRELDAIASRLRDAIESTPSPSAIEKGAWPRDLNAEGVEAAREAMWGADPKELSHG